MSVETEEDDQPTVIVNIDDPGAKPAIRKVIVLVGAAFGGLAELIRNLAREHSTVAAVATTAVVTVTATTVVPAVLDEDRHRPPPIAIERVVTLPAPSRLAATVTATITRDPQPSAAPPTKPARTVEPAALKTRLPTPDPTRSARSSSPVKTPVTTRARKSPTPAPQASDDEPVAALPATTPTRQPPGDTPAPEPQPSPVSDLPSQEPTVAAAGCGGIIHVDVDPLLDVCVLG